MFVVLQLRRGHEKETLTIIDKKVVTKQDARTLLIRAEGTQEHSGCSSSNFTSA